MYLTQVAVNAEGIRAILSSRQFERPPKFNVEHAVFDISDTDIKPRACAVCSKRTIDSTQLWPSQEYSVLAWGTLQTDSSMEHLVAYSTDEEAAVHSISSNRQVASLPYRQVVWLTRDRAFVVNGPPDYSMTKY